MRKILNMFSLEGKKAVITGGSGILDSAIARVFGKAGDEVSTGLTNLQFLI